MKISIITPSYNSGKTIEQAIQSVLSQDYSDYEHIIVDGGSTDETLHILRRYPHLKWISEPDRGQVHAMNKGFAMATGEVIGYLNADDHYMKGAFSAVIPHFRKGEKMVIGKVLVRSEKPGGVQEWMCDPKTDFSSVLRHWGPNAFCVNPVGYFYLREVQERIPLREETGAKHDLEFLMDSSLHFSVKKIDVVLGVFNHAQETQTGREQLIPGYWQPENFPFVDRLAATLTEEEQKQFRLERERGYQLRRQWTAKEAFARGMAKELFDKGEVFLLPEDENECAASRCGFVEHDRIGTRGDWIIPVMTMDNTTGRSICNALRALPKTILPAQIYHVHCKARNNSFPGVTLSLEKVFHDFGRQLYWKFIIGIKEPISTLISNFFQICYKKRPSSSEIIDYVHENADGVYQDLISLVQSMSGINPFAHSFSSGRRFGIMYNDNIQILIYRCEHLYYILNNIINTYFGISNVNLTYNSNDTYTENSTICNEIKTSVRFGADFLDKVYSSELVKSFYTSEEISLFKQKWYQEGDIANLQKKHENILTHNHNKTRKYLFICGCPRSGTTALWNLVSSHQDAAIGIERYYNIILNQNYISEELFVKDRFFKVKPSDTFYENLNGFSKYYDDLHSRYDGCKIYGDKIPKIYLKYKMITDNLPDVRFLFIVRNVYDVASSYNRRAMDARDINWRRNQDYREAVKDWNSSLQATLDNYEGLKISIIEYENLFFGEYDIDKLFEFIGLKVTRDVHNSYKNILLRARNVLSKETALTKSQREEVSALADFRSYEILLKKSLR